MEYLNGKFEVCSIFKNYPLIAIYVFFLLHFLELRGTFALQYIFSET